MTSTFLQDKKRFQPLKKVYLQMVDGAFINEATMVAFFGLRAMNFEIVMLEHKDFFHVELEPNAMACGGVNFMQDAFRKLGIRPVAALDIPRVLEPFCERKIAHTTLRELLASEPSFPLFVKPDAKGKLFDGTVVTNAYELELFKHYDGIDVPLMTSEVLKIVSEHRAFVVDRKIIDVRKYKGPYGKHPKLDVIENCILVWDAQPVAYSLDVAVTEEGKTVLIEANDAYSLGTYGLDPYSYVKMLILRWKEITAPVAASTP